MAGRADELRRRLRQTSGRGRKVRGLLALLAPYRGRVTAMPLVYHATAYAAGQELAQRLRASGSGGIVYSSVRRPGGECAAVFRPRLLSNCRQERHLAYVWDGETVRDVYEKQALRSGAPRA